MSIYVKKVFERILDDYGWGWSPNRYDKITELFNYPNLTREDMAYMFNHTPVESTMEFNHIMGEICCHPLTTVDWLNWLTKGGLVKGGLVNADIIWDKLVLNPNISTEIVEKYPDISWDWRYMHLLKDLNAKFILKHKHNDWDWIGIVSVINFEEFLELDFDNLRSIIPLAYKIGIGINNTKELSLCYHHLSTNTKITLQNVIDYPNLDWDAKGLIENPNIQKDLTIDNILLHVDTNATSTDIFPLLLSLLRFFVNKQTLCDDLVEKIRELPDSISSWLLLTDKYIEYSFDKLPYIDPYMLTSTMLRVIPLNKINQKVANFHNKCDTEIANVVTTHLEQGKETNCGIRQIIRQYVG